MASSTEILKALGIGGAAIGGAGALHGLGLSQLLEPLDYPRRSLANLIKSPIRALETGNISELLGAIPGAAGAVAGGLVGGPLGVLAGSALGGLLQGVGESTGREEFNAPSVADITGTEDLLPNLAVGIATDPLTYAGLGATWRAAKGLKAASPVSSITRDAEAGAGIIGTAAEKPAYPGSAMARKAKPKIIAHEITPFSDKDMAAHIAKTLDNGGYANHPEFMHQLPEGLSSEQYSKLANAYKAEIDSLGKTVGKRTAKENPYGEVIDGPLAIRNYGTEAEFNKLNILSDAARDAEKAASEAMKLEAMGRTANNFDWRPNEITPEDMSMMRGMRGKESVPSAVSVEAIPVATLAPAIPEGWSIKNINPLNHKDGPRYQIFREGSDKPALRASIFASEEKATEALSEQLARTGTKPKASIAQEAASDIPTAKPIAPTFYSRLEETIASMPDKPMSVEKARAWLDPTKGKFAKAEMEWTGVDDLLASKKAGEQVTKKELMARFGENKIEVDLTVRKGIDAVHEPSTTPGGENYRELILKMKGKPGAEVYSEPHGMGDNALGHFRVNDRVGPKGAKTLHVEEVQPQWSQTGRKEGYLAKEEVDLRRTAQKKLAEIEEQIDIVRRKNPGVYTEEEQALQASGVKYRDDFVKNAEKVPDMPFKDQASTDLMMKRLIRYAAENGYDAISLNKGEQINKILAGGGADAVNKSSLVGQAKYYGSSMPAEEIGKIAIENAEEVVTRSAKNAGIPMVDDDFHLYVQRSLKAGEISKAEASMLLGDMTREQYGKAMLSEPTLPNWMEKYAKQHGVKIEQGIGSDGSDDLYRRFTEAEGDAKKALENQYYDQIDYEASSPTRMPVSRSMREQAMTRGFPLLSAGGAAGAGGLAGMLAMLEGRQRAS